MARRTKKNVGVIGLGIIGSRVADNLRRLGFHVFVWNRNPGPVPNFVGARPGLAGMGDYIRIFVSEDVVFLVVVRNWAAAWTPGTLVFRHRPGRLHQFRSAAVLCDG